MFKKSIVIIFLILFLPAMVAFSQEPKPTAAQTLTTAETTQVTWPPSPMGTAIGPNTLFHVFIQYVYEWGISLGGIAVFVMLVWAGIQYLTSAGDPVKMGSAIKRIQSSVLGLVLLLTSWLILNTINPQLVQLRKLPYLGGDLKMGAIKMPDSTSPLPPCDFIIVYPEANYQGAKGKPLRFRKGSQPDSDVIEILRREGNRNIVNYGRIWTSVKNFIRLTEEEKRMIGNNGLNITRYDECGNINDTGEYREGGHCDVIFYFTTGGFLGFGSDPCGMKLAEATLPIPQFSRIKQRPEALTCIEAIRTIPRCIPEENKSCPKELSGVEQCPGPEIINEPSPWTDFQPG